MITGVLPRARKLVDAGRYQKFAQGRTEQEMVDAQPGIAGEGVPEILPERIDPLFGMQQPDGVRPAMAMNSA